VVVLGTGTEVGKTWVTVAVIRELGRRGRRAAARKPVQSFAPGAVTDAHVLAAATGEAAGQVCPPHRWYERPMAPPMAADALGRPGFTVADLVGELEWPPGVDVGLIEGAGGVRSPLADDGDAVTLVAALGPEHVVVVASPALGALNLVRLSVDALAGSSPEPVAVVHLNRFDPSDELQRRNRAWMENRMGLTTTTTAAELVTQLAPEGIRP
jgi:dethiobiotin synthetase